LACGLLVDWRDQGIGQRKPGTGVGDEGDTMIRILAVGLALGLSASCALAQTDAASARSMPMQFQWRFEGPAKDCGAKCRTWVSAVGTITADTIHDFKEFARAHDLRGATLALDSGGGSVHGAMALGREIRRLGMITTVGKTTALGRLPGRGVPRARLSPRADCESMCVFVLLGGTKRIVPDEARLMVHQIWLGDRRDDAAAATYSAEDLVLVQRDIGRLARYTIEMGGSVDFLELSLRIPPWEPMRALTRAEIASMQVEAGPQVTPPEFTSSVTSASAFAPALRGGEAEARGWTLSERSGRPVLLRRHPLTVEGVEIGSFDLTLGCGERRDLFSISYGERRAASGKEIAPLTTVTLSLGERSAPLRIVSSEPAVQSHKVVTNEVNTQAHGSVPVVLIRRYSALSGRALMVSTVDASDARTAIRVGNSGIGPALVRLEEHCGRPSLHATNARNGQAGGR
jgi:hypothetical protein